MTTTAGAQTSAPAGWRWWRPVVAVALCTIGCVHTLSGAPTDPTGEASTVQPSQSGVTVAVTADHDTVPAGAPLRITVTVRNGTPTTRQLSFTSGCSTDYELVDTTGAVTATSGQMCMQVITGRTLAAGDTLAEVHVLLRGRPGMPVVPPGAYRLRGVLLLAGSPERSPMIPIQFR